MPTNRNIRIAATPKISHVKKARQASADELAQSVPMQVNLKDVMFNSHVIWASQLGDSERENIWAIANDNMCDMATASSMGWDPESKKKELYHSESRFIVSRLNNETGGENIAGFVMFRFEKDYGQKLLYCYELQISPTFQRSGLGRFFIECLTRIANHWHMDVVMLTVLKVNEAAMQFYKAMGFKRDPVSPEPEENADYEILSVEI